MQHIIDCKVDTEQMLLPHTHTPPIHPLTCSLIFLTTVRIARLKALYRLIN